ncbi:MAG: hypothetical protein MRERV_1c052 [Mycoplasmataceae bacterium RV_VA103A]|nr:MAG: hypothetical protein MRERV_10c059 [Mycoplasmataceae bacterium RV_VA103A]KLL05379.1 MAG: hypothetical protein MRERV_1c052 [Mycoplasmataceae bacterium RV_VA103A]
MYTLKPALKVNCFQCRKKLIVNFCPPRQHYSNKNNWGYWTSQKKNQGQYRCDACLIDMYRNHKLVYLDSITDSKKRRTFRDYFGGSLPLTRTQQKKLQNLKRGEGKLYHILKRKGINLDEEGLSDYFKKWQQIILKLIQDNSLQVKKIKELEKKLAKKEKKR